MFQVMASATGPVTVSFMEALDLMPAVSVNLNGTMNKSIENGSSKRELDSLIVIPIMVIWIIIIIRIDYA
jgi:hypothetical protein